MKVAFYYVNLYMKCKLRHIDESCAHFEDIYLIIHIIINVKRDLIQNDKYISWICIFSRKYKKELEYMLTIYLIVKV